MSQKKLKHFANWLLDIMNRNSITVEALANRSGVSRKDVRNWIRGNSIPKTAYFVFLLKALSQIINCEEEILYKNASEAILRDS
jgi:transcriptional regulator with XRE-family HTH domain|tara:strand:+ start:200 stop:451 length:252 start_codon:yes stop_codon:yes gene_type:complete